MTLLPSEAFRLEDGDALHARLLQRFLDLVELERLDDRLDLFHGVRYLLLRLARRGRVPRASDPHHRPLGAEFLLLSIGFPCALWFRSRMSSPGPSAVRSGD